MRVSEFQNLAEPAHQMPKEVPVPKLFCYRCGVKGKVVQIHETVPTPRGRLDMPHFRCRSCLNTWYDQADVLAYVFALSSPPSEEQAMVRKVEQLPAKK